MSEYSEKIREAVANKIKQEIDMEEYEAMKAKFREIEARAEHFEAMAKRLEVEKETAYLRGRIDGLEFSIRCNGVSGDIAK